MPYFRTIVEVEVLSNEPLVMIDLDELHYQITDGHMSGIVAIKSTEQVSAERMSELLIAQGSDPDFLLDEE